MENREPHIETDMDPEFQKGLIVPVEQMIPNIKPKTTETDLSKEEFQKTNNAFPTPIIGALYKEIENGKLQNFFKDFEGQIVVDLGPGENVLDHRIVSAAKARGYIGVEPFNYKELAEDFKKHGNSKRYEKFGLPVTAALVEQDALSFLKRLPDKSVSFFASGLDLNIIKDQSYSEGVSREIERTLSTGGAFITHDSVFELDQKQGFARSRPDPGEDDLVYRLFKYKRTS